MANKVFVVTGATSGIGKALALDLAQTGEVLVMIARAAERGDSALKEIRLASKPPQKVTESIIQAAVAPEFEKTTGKFLHNGKEI